jgi:hypothetical protein
MSIPARQDETQDETNQEFEEALPRHGLPLYGLRDLPWTSEPRREETNRLQEAVIEAAQRMGREPPASFFPATAQRQRHTDLNFRLAEALSNRSSAQDSVQESGQDNDPQNDLEEMNRRICAGLMPKFVAPPPREPMSLPGLGMTSGLVGAVIAAAAIALVIVQIPMLSPGPSNEDDVRNGPSTASTALGTLTRLTAAEAKPGAPDPAAVPAGALLAAVPTNDVAAPSPPVPRPPVPITLPPEIMQPSPQPSPEVEAVRPEIATPRPAAAPEARPTISMTHSEIAAMLKRGQDLIAAGDIPSARLVLTHLAEAGDANAAFILAGTYDPAVLATRRIVGVQPDAAKARAWYAKAAEQGSSEARRRLNQSALR